MIAQGEGRVSDGTRSRGKNLRPVMATLKDLKLKTGVCKRTLKELHSYEVEEKREAAKTQAMRDNNADPYDIKQQVMCKQSRALTSVLVF